MMACQEGCKYYIRVSNKVWEYVTTTGILDFAGVKPGDVKVNYCAANAKFIKSAIFACSVKDHGIQEKEFKGLKASFSKDN